MISKYFFQSSSDILQYVLPTVVGIGDVLPDLKKAQYLHAVQKTIKIATLIFIQNRVAILIKQLTKKPRPSFPHDFTSFPSGHMMIAMQSLVHVTYRERSCSFLILFVALGNAFIFVGRYLPGKHDIVDLTAGAILGGALGYVWNKWI